MNFINENKYRIIVSIVLGIIYLQIVDFLHGFFTILFVGLLKVILTTSALIIALKFIKKWYYKLTACFMLLFIIFLSYQIPLWRISANLHIFSKGEEYIEVYYIVKKDSNFAFIMYDADGGHLNFAVNNPSQSIKDQKEITNFIIANGNIEIWKDNYGVAFIYDRFLDNRHGLLYCPDSNNCKIIDTTYFKNKIYTKIRDNWYLYDAN